MKLFLLIILIFIAVFAYPVEITLTHQRSIGDDADDDYTFFRIRGAVITDEKEIIMSDDKGVFLAKYTWDGKFVKRVGQKGRGPGDFLSMRGLYLIQKKLYIYDGKNRRIAITDTDLSKFDYVSVYPLKERGEATQDLTTWIYALGANKYLALKTLLKKGDNFLFQLNDQRQIGKRFFKELPIDGAKLEETILFPFYIKPMVGIDRFTGNLLVSFKFTANEIVFFKYSMAGDFIKKFKYKQDNTFQFPTALINKKNKKGDKFSFTMIGSIHAHKGFSLVFITEFRDFIEEVTDNPESLNKSKDFVLVFDKKGNFVARAQIDNNLHIYHISPEGDVLATDAEQELFGDSQKLLIYKLAIK